MNNSTFVKKWFDLNYLNEIEIKQETNQKRSTLKELNERRKTLLTIKE